MFIVTLRAAHVNVIFTLNLSHNGTSHIHRHKNATVFNHNNIDKSLWKNISMFSVNVHCSQKIMETFVYGNIVTILTRQKFTSIC